MRTGGQLFHFGPCPWKHRRPLPSHTHPDICPLSSGKKRTCLVVQKLQKDPSGSEKSLSHREPVQYVLNQRRSKSGDTVTSWRAASQKRMRKSRWDGHELTWLRFSGGNEGSPSWKTKKDKQNFSNFSKCHWVDRYQHTRLNWWTTQNQWFNQLLLLLMNLNLLFPIISILKWLKKADNIQI